MPISFHHPDDTLRYKYCVDCGTEVLKYDADQDCEGRTIRTVLISDFSYKAMVPGARCKKCAIAINEYIDDYPKVMKMKLNHFDATALIMISEHSEIDGSRTLVSTLEYQSHILGGVETVSEKSIRSLATKGLVKTDRKHAKTIAVEAYITEEGRLLVESWRENGTWPVKVKL